jgi:hypothetical protein
MEEMDITCPGEKCTIDEGVRSAVGGISVAVGALVGDAVSGMDVGVLIGVCEGMGISGVATQLARITSTIHGTIHCAVRFILKPLLPYLAYLRMVR